MGVIAAVTGLMVTVWIFSHIDDWGRDLTTNVASLDEAASDPLLRPLISEMSAQQLLERIDAFVAQRSNWQIADQEQQVDQLKVHLTRRTPLMRFTDDIYVTITPHDSGTILNAESKSRVGKGDLGQNPRNLKELVAAVQSQQ